MIIGGDKTKVVENIKDLAEKRQLNSKVEVDDPNMSEQEEQQLLTDFIAERATLSYHSKNMIARQGMALATDILNRQTIVTGAQNIMGIIGGAIVTSNHFNPLENTAIRYALKKVNNKRLFVISQPTNFKMTGWVGFFLKYADTLPISRSIHYMGRTFPTLLQNIFVKNNYVLIYPEKEMWFNYRKPRPFKRGLIIMLPALMCQ
jgi:1-acyl-sn-glycerol-3-phosphate acyltransferase